MARMYSDALGSCSSHRFAPPTPFPVLRMQKVQSLTHLLVRLT